MKARAGTVGQQGLGPLLGDLAGRRPGLRVHLIGHSFGGRLVSFTLAGLPAGKPSPVASLTLLEGAFSHFAFAASLPQDTGRGGALNGMAARVNGPLLACFSTFDLALAIMYPAASMTADDDAAGLADDLKFRFGGMGHDGAQAVGAAQTAIQEVGGPYQFVAQKFTNIDCSRVVRTGGPPSGAHSDIVHPQLAWAMLTAAGLV
jgi:pimeloyl-ACP methyl ester carboxylesterase